MVTPPGIPDEKVKKMKPSFKERYGDRWKEVLYATLWKNKESYQEETQLDERGPIDLLKSRYRLKNKLSDLEWSNKENHKAGLKNDRDLEKTRRIKNKLHKEETQLDEEEIPYHIRAKDIATGRSNPRFSSEWERAEWEKENKNLLQKQKKYREAKGIKETLDEAKFKWQPQVLSAIQRASETERAKKGRSWNPPEVQAASAKYKKEQRGFDKGLAEINRQRKKEGLKRTTANSIRKEYNPKYLDPSENPTPPAIGKWEYEHIRKGKPIR